jgi:nitrous oxide reductase accessory protein NosL
MSGKHIMNSKCLNPRSAAGRFVDSLIGLPAGLVLTLLIASCGPSEIRPVEIFAEDQCSSCRMAVSNPAFASEIVYDDGSAAKFDDLGCFDNYRKAHPDERYAAIFVMNYESKQWMPYGKSIIIRTGIETPMGSGQIAVSDQEAAARLKKQYPPKLASKEGGSCCARPNP